MTDWRTVTGALRGQAEWCERLGSPLYATLLTEAAADVESGGPVATLLRDDPAPLRGMLPLRFMGAAHRMALEDRAPALAAHLPSTGGDGDAMAAWRALRELVEAEGDALRSLLVRPVQTNEVGRAGGLMPGFLTVARETGLPLRLLEVGASAGLNLRWDRFHYRLGEAEWGDPGSPVRLAPRVAGAPPPLGPAEVAERRGCDRAPLDPAREDTRLTLLSFVWPDQTARFERLRAALDLARAVPAPVDEADAVDWVRATLAEPAPGVASVVFHSVVIQYLERADQAALADVIAEAGARVSAEAPLAWLRMEPGGEQAEVRLTVWPRGEERLVAAVDFHVSRIDFAAVCAAPQAAQERA